MKRLFFLGVPLECHSVSSYQQELRQLLDGAGADLVVTPNPEMLVASERDPSLKDVLSSASLRVVDGFGLVLLSGFRLQRFPGTDAFSFVTKEALQRGLRVMVVGGAHMGDALKAAQRVGGEHVLGFTPSEIRLTEHGWVGDETLVEAIQAFDPEVLFLGLGHGKQEKWLADHLLLAPSLRLCMGVGGAIEFFAGRQIRAPRVFRRFGIEWVYRLIREPRRIGRIFTAVVVFPCLVFWSKIKHNA